MKKASVVLVGLLMMIVSFQSARAQKQKYHSMFIYNFTRYVKWPDAQSSGTFVIGVLGNSAIQKELETMATTKRVNGMSIEVKNFSTIEEIHNCHILYVSTSETDKMEQVVSSTQNQSILIVTDNPGMAEKGASINFVEVDGKIKFELNQQNIQTRGLKVASSLTSLAILV